MIRSSNQMGSNARLLSQFLALPQPDKSVQVTYVWIDGAQGLRSKTKTVTFIPQTAAELPLWNFDSGSTYQSAGNDSDVFLKAIRLYRDPFRLGNNKLALCETVTYDGKPTASNTRHSCNLVMSAAADQKPWFGIEQEFFLMDGFDQNRPFNWPKNGSLDPVNPHHCGVGTGRVVARDLINIHIAACLYAGVKLGGINAEGCLAQWEFQVGPCEGISIGDDLWMARYLLQRIAEDYHISVTFDPRPVEDSMFCNGAHTNFSTKAMRQPGGFAAIEAALPKLARNHMAHIAKYDPRGGADNARRLTGGLVTAPIDQFVSGVGMRNASVRIPKQCAIDGCGYLEDRRPSSNVDPYLVASMLVKTICLDE